MKRFLIIFLFSIYTLLHAQTDVFISSMPNTATVDSAYLFITESPTTTYNLTFWNFQNQLRTKYLDTAYAAYDSIGVSGYADSSGVSGIADSSIVTAYADSSGVTAYADSSGVTAYADSSGVSGIADSSIVSAYADSSSVSAFADSALVASLAYSIDSTANIVVTDLRVKDDLTVTDDLIVSGNIGSHLIPSLADTWDIGSSTLLWRKGWLSELETLLFAENTITLLGGWFYVTKDAGTVAEDVDNSETQIDFGKSMTNNDFIVFRGNTNLEYMQITSAVGGTVYNVTRNVDGSGANAWPEGSPFAVLGYNGDGRIELNAYDTPRISMIRQGTSYNAQTELIRLGDLNGIYGYGSETWGLGIGEYASGHPNFTIDQTNGLRIKNYQTVMSQWDNSGNILIGSTGAGNNNIYITADSMSFRTNTTPSITLSTGGTGFFRGAITSTATITGGTIQTATINKRVVLNNNRIQFYDASNTDCGYLEGAGGYISSVGTFAGGDISAGEFQISGTAVINSSKNITNIVNIDATGNITANGAGALLGEGGLGIGSSSEFNVDANGNIIRINNVSTLKYVPIGTGAAFTPRRLVVADLTALTASKIAVTDASGYLAASAIASSDLFTPAYGELYDDGASSTITCNGSNYIRWTGASVGVTQNITGSDPNYKLTVNAGHGGKYLVNYSVSYTVATNDDYYWTVLQNSSPIGKARQAQYADTDTDPITITGSCILDLAATDYIQLGCYSTNTRVVTVTYVNLNITKIGN